MIRILTLTLTFLGFALSCSMIVSNWQADKVKALEEQLRQERVITRAFSEQESLRLSEPFLE